MTQSLQIFIEYKIKKETINEYEQVMKEILQELPSYEASNIEWFVASDQPYLYVEMFEVPTTSHYHVLKKLRQSEDHRLFGKIIPMVEGGASAIHCWAFERKKQGDQS
ncbi:hypothetical protein P4637_18395 [Halalkalibacterium halodurans]|jgi:hypothetical protein|uniref:Uncharacterized protein n=1 Tax=Halalkalibacterium halodurans TaxID=86665 RepID=A0A0M0KCV1_ALKHA|nr:hypothetical protein [Halalkalibacterium halodurans]MDY7221428.1 hypothetical protein [Halalkalibacterium halodurans]MDY7240667.1 hypothetical protein [Halalkalibacterium halodurans]MED3648367.1 hypothetical protein [Halalkalibacterium halodurans]MED4082955.1 hypothetical protein [Halalkalibacterium halodurans]MED4086786.1 hypothetical protein [Halalkalibacterium halodurans]